MLRSIPFSSTESFSILVHRDGRVLYTVCQLQNSGSRHLMPPSTEFTSSISAPTISTSFRSFGFHDLAKRRLMCIVKRPTIV